VVKYLKRWSILILLVWCGYLQARSNAVPVPIEDPIYQFLSRQAAKGYLTGYNEAILPMTRGQIAFWLQQIQSHESQLTTVENQLLQEYLADFRQELMTTAHRDLTGGASLYYPFQDKATLGRHVRELFSRQPGLERKHLVIYEEGDDFIWGDCEAIGRLEQKDGEVRLVNADRWTIQGNWAQHFAFRLHAARYRRSYNRQFTEPLYEDRNVWGMYITDSLYTYDFNHTAFTYYNDWLRVGLYHQPLRLGYSPAHSLLISNNAPAFPHIGLQAQIKTITFTYLHADLLNDSTHCRDLPAETKNRSKYLALQRIDMSFWREKLRLGYTIMVVYGDRHRELAYLTPVNFFWLTQHTLEDRDNTLMALDGKFNLLPGVTLFATLLLDELRFSELGQHWWANKQGLQGGVQFYPVVGKLPLNLIIEYTAVRPWVYTHKYLTSNFTHNAFCLGYPYGGNAQSFWLHADAYLSRRLWIQADYTQIHQGIDENGRYYGGDVRSNYEWREPAYDHATRWLMGPQRTTHQYRLQSGYEIFNDMFLTGDLVINRVLFKGQRTTENYEIFNDMFLTGDLVINRVLFKGQRTTENYFSFTWRIDI